MPAGTQRIVSSSAIDNAVHLKPARSTSDSSDDAAVIETYNSNKALPDKKVCAGY